MAIGKRGLGSTRWKLSPPARMALSAAIAAVLAGFGGYILWAGEIRMPFRWTHRWSEPVIHLRFAGGEARLLAVGFLFVAAAVLAQMALVLRTKPTRPVESRLALVLAVTGILIIGGLYAGKLLGLM